MRFLPLALLRLGSPPVFYSFAGPAGSWLAGIGLLLFVAGAYVGLFLAPPDYQQGESYRIIFVHVPAAWLSMLAYVVMAAAGAVHLVWRAKVAGAVMAGAAVPGASFTALALLTGSLWGKPMWGTFWVWDARLTSELILLFLYLGFVALRQAIPERGSSLRAGAILLLAGVVNIPVIHYSVEWWHTLHQPASVAKFDAPSMHPAMLVPLLIMSLSCTLIFLALAVRRARSELLLGERYTRWARTAAAV